MTEREYEIVRAVEALSSARSSLGNIVPENVGIDEATWHTVIDIISSTHDRLHNQVRISR